MSQRVGLSLVVLSLLASDLLAQQIPHNQSAPPGPPLSPEEAIAKMVVPDGFRVEVVASEPMIVNPVAMTFDEKGRIWITESLEYPRREPGPGRDRVKVLEDTDGDGKADKATVFAEGLNIPSGIAVGHGGVWVGNSPDILFYPDADRDGVADGPPRVIVTGFGRADTHELPNSLTWGPDGWLYGWNGVFNPSKITYRGKTHEFTCAIFRIHPRDLTFEVFCEGTSNPWGIAINDRGDFFASACVIDHLWHLVEGAYYVRQGGPYPPFTWPMGSIVQHTHQKAAYCGVHYFDSTAFPEKYRGKLYMGNIHGNCINVDSIQADGPTYKATPEPDFLSANDAWFMPVSQKTGPDGNLYVLDWYDRYHCYQDANRDPAGIDRLKGRLYRVRYQDSPRRVGLDLARDDDATLIRRLDDPNVYDRDVALRLMTERLAKSPAARPSLEKVVLGDGPARHRRAALWALIGSGRLDFAFHKALLDHKDNDLRAWAVRAAGNQGNVDEAIATKLSQMAGDAAPEVRLQVAIALPKLLDKPAAVAGLSRVLTGSPDDRLIAHVVWQRLHPSLGSSDVIAHMLKQMNDAPSPLPSSFRSVWPRLLDRALAAPDVSGEQIADATRLGLEKMDDPATTGALLEALTRAVRDERLRGDRRDAVRSRLEPVIKPRLHKKTDRARVASAQLAAAWGDTAAHEVLHEVFADPKADANARVASLEVLAAAQHADALDEAARLLADRTAPVEFRARVISTLGAYEDARLGTILIESHEVLEPELRSRSIDVLTQRPHWTAALVRAIEEKKVPASAVNANHLRKMKTIKDDELAARIKALLGTVREGRNPQREEVVNRMRRHIAQTPGDPFQGQQVFQRVCGACHKMHGEGQDVGPDLTSNGRNDLDQLISNVFDPSLVIGAGYQATIIATTDGRVLNGLLVEDTPQRVILKLQGGKLETVPRDDLDELRVAEVSLMPEDLEKQLQPQEIADLFSYLGLDRPPTDPSAKRLPGLPEPMRRATDR
jgi:putative heme-binding domain-containing protein